MSLRKEFPGPNYAFLLELYDRYRSDPTAVSQSVRDFFDSVEIEEEGYELPAKEIGKAIAAANLAAAIRRYGYLAARLDPLGGDPPGDPHLRLESWNLTDSDLERLPADVVGPGFDRRAESARHAIHNLRQLYCGAIGYDYGHVRNPQERKWLQEVGESGRFRPPDFPVDDLGLLARLSQVEAFERFLHRIFPGRTRFSIEGVDMLVPMLDNVVGGAVDTGMKMVFIGMAHRGRLNVLAHILGKPYGQILAEFKDPRRSFREHYESGWSGDVKYHKGMCVSVEEGEQGQLTICMPPNPSHLEHVNPVVEGMARAYGTAADARGEPAFSPDESLPVLIHGDASFPGQGIVSESLNLSRLPGYRTGGTIHIIADNQLGFTATEEETRSTLFASDLAKGFKIPILHVNADEPLACIEAARTAFAYRARFHKDFLIHLLGYRRYGHNEGDEPSFTLPDMYETIRDRPSVRRLWADRLVDRGEIEGRRAEALMDQRMDKLQEVLHDLDAQQTIDEPVEAAEFPRPPEMEDTGVPLEDLSRIHRQLLELPEGFHLHPKLQRFMRRRRGILDDPNGRDVDWATAESLAFGSILLDGIPIRLSGEDSVRGTFNQRHAAFYDVETGEPYFPLQHLGGGSASFEAVNSPLSEASVLGFEFGYDIQAPQRLVIWEAQYGDFINGAQVFIDEFVVASRAKWGERPSLVLMLPHGNEGQGPDHSSARPERFLQMAANLNFRLVAPTSAAQFFHLLRGQAKLLEANPTPLIVLAPKGLLRHPLVSSAPLELAEGSWHPVIDDAKRRPERDAVKRVILCSGRVFVDLLSSPEYEQVTDVAVVRLEQIYPFPKEDLAPMLEAYPALEEIWWVQEEPRNMGAWPNLQEPLEELIDGRWALVGLTRLESASPAEGSTAWYQAVQRSLVEGALVREDAGEVDGVMTERE
jgi:2-oxoglutarate dehydrogenase E1 component